MANDLIFIDFHRCLSPDEFWPKSRWKPDWRSRSGSSRWGAAIAGDSCGSTAEVRYSEKHTRQANHEHPPLHVDHHPGQWFHFLDSGRSQDGNPIGDLGPGQDQHWDLDRSARRAVIASGSCGSTAEVRYLEKHTRHANHEHPPLHADHYLGQRFHFSMIFIDVHWFSLICID